MSEITITNGKILKGDKVSIEYLKPPVNGNKPAKVSEEHSDPPHPDLKNAFKTLNLHAAMIGEFIEPRTIEVTNLDDADENLAADYHVSGFTIVGEDLTEGVILSAQKKLKTGRTMGFNTPIQLFQDPLVDPYPWGDHLKICIDACKSELAEYLDGKFTAPQESSHKQPVIPGIVDGNEEESKPKRGRRKADSKIVERVDENKEF